MTEIIEENRNWTEQVEFSLDLKRTILNSSKPYVFFAFDHYDFDIEDANFDRMVQQAEEGFKTSKN